MGLINSFEDAVNQVAPSILAELPQTTLIAPLIMNAVSIVEGLFKGAPSGTQSANKLQGALQLVKDGVAIVNTKKPGVITEISDTLDKAVSAVVDAANLVHAGAQAQNAAQLSATGTVSTPQPK